MVNTVCVLTPLMTVAGAEHERPGERPLVVVPGVKSRRWFGRALLLEIAGERTRIIDRTSGREPARPVGLLHRDTRTRPAGDIPESLEGRRGGRESWLLGAARREEEAPGCHPAAGARLSDAAGVRRRGSCTGTRPT